MSTQDLLTEWLKTKVLFYVFNEFIRIIRSSYIGWIHSQNAQWTIELLEQSCSLSFVTPTRSLEPKNIFFSFFKAAFHMPTSFSAALVMIKMSLLDFLIQWFERVVLIVSGNA